MQALDGHRSTSPQLNSHTPSPCWLETGHSVLMRRPVPGSRRRQRPPYVPALALALLLAGGLLVACGGGDEAGSPGSDVAFPEPVTTSAELARVERPSVTVVLRATATGSVQIHGSTTTLRQSELCLDAVGLDPDTGEELGSVGGCDRLPYVLEDGKLTAEPGTAMRLESGGSFQIHGDDPSRTERVTPVWGVVPCACEVELILGQDESRFLDASNGGFVDIVQPGRVTAAVARNADGTEIARTS